MTVDQRIDEPNDRFPVGMRILAVDDDLACLKLLEALLRKCQYHVTTTNQAVTALKLLRENRNNFDLVISDVHMPDMDGLKLLELVGLEMDLPVIMLSANGDTRFVMKGITHGACDYLLKPIRMEELKNIWQHVIRRKKFDPKPHHKNGGGGGLLGTESDPNGKGNKKRKDQKENGNEENEENIRNNNNDDTSTQKKPRVVWSAELHRKFVAAVSQLGIERAVPKRILDLMNVEKLSRENVASHLQKYRAYLKRISIVANQQATMAAVLRGTEHTFPQIRYSNGIGNNRARSGQFQNSTVRSLSPSGMLGRLNSPSGLVTHGLSSSGLVQVGHVQNTSNPMDDPGMFQRVMVPGHQNGNVLLGLPPSQDLDQQNDGFTLVREPFINHVNSMDFPVNSGFSDTNINFVDSRNSLGVTNNAILLEGRHEEYEKGGVFANPSSVTMPPLNEEYLSHLEDYGRCDENWQGAVQSSQVLGNSLTLSDNSSLVVTHFGHSTHELSLITSGLDQMLDSQMDLRSQVASVSDSVGHNFSYIQKQRWDDRIVDDRSNLLPESMNSFISAHGVVGPLTQGLERNNTMFRGDNDFNLIEPENFAGINHSPMDSQLGLKQRYLMEQRKPVGNHEYSKVDSLEDLL